jgi:threonine dehydratase
MSTVSVNNVLGARERIRNEVHRTPLIRLPVRGVPDLYAKAENLQRTGSFKLRGAYNFLASLPADVRARGVVAQSSGNHAQGVACAAFLLGVPATIVIPEGAPAIKVERTRSWGARIVRCGNSAREREETAAREAEAQDLTIVPPFDHPLTIAGQGTVALELLEQLPEVSNVLVPVGGGGLISGIALTIKALRPETQVIGVEPELAADAAASLQQGKRVRWDAGLVNRTIADGVRTQEIGELNFELMRQHVDGMVSVSESSIRDAVRWYALEAKLVVEPTGGITLAAWRALQAGGGAVQLRPGPTALIVSGGNVDPGLFASLVTAGAALEAG